MKLNKGRKPKISIIIPIYNAEKYIEKCINSILMQTFQDFEIILVNDGSTDDSKLICDNYVEKDCRIRLINKKNGGAASARNLGIEHSNGKYISFIDIDDYIAHNMYEVLYRNAIKYSSDLVICEFISINEDEIYEFKNETNNSKEIKLSNKEALSQLYKEKEVTFVVPWNKLYKSELFKELRYEEGRICEDEFIIHQLLFLSKNIVYISDVMYGYVQSKNSVMRSKFSIKRIDGLYALKDRINFFEKNKLKDLSYKAQERYVGIFFDLYYKVKNEVEDSDNILKDMKKQFVEIYYLLIKNPLFKWKQKIIWHLFIFNPIIYEFCIIKATRK